MLITTLGPSLKCRYDVCVGQIFLSLIRFVEIFISLNEYIMKIIYIIYLMILRCIININIFLKLSTLTSREVRIAVKKDGGSTSLF